MNGIAHPSVPGWTGAYPTVNIHHLELFYHVARNGGISRAVRHMPYGIQQPAVSGQMRLLEQDLGTRLFDRAPFRLTETGEQLYAFAQPFFDNLEPMAARLRQGTAPLFRVGASELVLRDHMPEVVRQLKNLHPRLRVGLRTGRQPQLEAWLLDRQLDLAVTLLETLPSRRLRCTPIMCLPLVLLVPINSRIESAAQLWAQGLVEEPLITLPGFDLFQKQLRHLKVDWPPAIEAGSLELTMQYVANGYGIGVTGDLPAIAKHRKVRALPLPGFPPLEIACLWLGKPTPLVEEAIARCRQYVGEHWPQQAVSVAGGSG